MASDRALHEFEHGFGRFTVKELPNRVTILLQVGGRPVNLNGGLDGRILLDEVVRLRALLEEILDELDSWPAAYGHQLTTSTVVKLRRTLSLEAGD